MAVPAETWDLYDSLFRRVGTIARGERIPDGYYHVGVEVIPTDMAGHLLITQRSFEKRRGAGFLEFPAGSVLAGENPNDAAIRELFEETGLRAEKLIKLQRNEVPGLIRLTYLAIIPDLLTAQIILQENETISYQIVSFDEWLNTIVDGRFDPSRSRLYKPGLFSYLRDRIGSSNLTQNTKPVKPVTILRASGLPRASRIPKANGCNHMESSGGECP